MCFSTHCELTDLFPIADIMIRVWREAAASCPRTRAVVSAALGCFYRPLLGLLPKPLRKTCLTNVATLATSTRPNSLETVEIQGVSYPQDEMSNVTPTIASRVGRNLHHIPHHPICIIKQRIVHHFHKTYVTRTGNPIYAHFDNVSPVVSTEQNFDSLLVPQDHVARSKEDNYYIDSATVLRAHTSAHQRDFIQMGLDKFLVTGDVYRRDEIDSSHYPVFHQMEGVGLFSRDELFGSASDSPQLFEHGSVETDEKQVEHTIHAVLAMEANLKQTLTRLVKDLFGHDLETRWNLCYFPFTHPSYELEIKFQGEWLEVLGSGIMRQPILTSGGTREKIGWAFGLGLDRLAMLLFDIPDIRLFWSQDPRFIEQFQSVGIDPQTNVRFKPFSKFPPCVKDIAFWLPEDGEFSENDFFETVRSIGKDLVEKVELIDKFQHPKSGRTSHCYRVTYRSMDKTFTNEEINILQSHLRETVPGRLNVELR